MHISGLAHDVVSHVAEVERLGLRLHRIPESVLRTILSGNLLDRSGKGLAQLRPQLLVLAELVGKLLVPHGLHDLGQRLAVEDDLVTADAQLETPVEGKPSSAVQPPRAVTWMDRASALYLLRVTLPRRKALILRCRFQLSNMIFTLPFCAFVHCKVA